MLPEAGAGERIAAGTGHRLAGIQAHDITWTRRQVDMGAVWLAEGGYKVGITGMASGFDLWWGLAVLNAGMELWAAIPFEEQRAGLSPEEQKTWDLLRDRARHEVVLGDVRGNTEDARRRRRNQLLAARNQIMVLRTDFLVCCWTQGRTRHCGTYQAIGMAHRRKPPLLGGVHIDPTNRSIDMHLPALVAEPGRRQRVAG